MNKRPTDVWEDDEPLHKFEPAGNVKGQKKQPERIKDDWDDDDDDEENDQRGSATVARPIDEQSGVGGLGAQESHLDRSEEDGQGGMRIVVKPKPLPSSNRNNNVIESPLPPEVSFEPSFRILKRPKQSGPSPTPSNASGDSKKTLQEREESYRLARERIFGSSPSPSSSLPTSPDRGLSPAPGALKTADNYPTLARRDEDREQTNTGSRELLRPVRDPLGPDSQVPFSRKPKSTS